MALRWGHRGYFNNKDPASIPKHREDTSRRNIFSWTKLFNPHGWKLEDDGEVAVLEHMDLYRTLHSGLTAPGGIRSTYETDLGTGFVYSHRPSNLTFTYAEDVQERGCPLTVVFMDPRLPVLPAASPAFFSLESVAAYAEESCVLLLTASCEVRELLLADEHDEEITEEISRLVALEMIYNNSLPLFRQMADRGQVRVGFPNHEKYKLKSASNFYNPSSALQNVHFWQDEFTAADSDFVLVIQDDAVLCHRLDANLWREFAYVGGVWPQKSNPLSPVPLEGMCIGMPNRWRSWTLPQRRWTKQLERSGEAKDALRPPFEPLEMEFPRICQDDIGPIGNGGLSLRSRKWLIAAINACPHIERSGIDFERTALACKVIDDVNEDFYFGTVLQGLRAPLPTAFEAALFSTEMLWPEEVLDLYGELGEEERELLVAKRWGKSKLPRYLEMQGGEFTVPLGMHKPWWYKNTDVLLGKHVTENCPFLQFIFQPDDSKWFEFVEAEPWHGIGK